MRTGEFIVVNQARHTVHYYPSRFAVHLTHCRDFLGLLLYSRYFCLVCYLLHCEDFLGCVGGGGGNSVKRGSGNVGE
jgi:hypothetical protein